MEERAFIAEVKSCHGLILKLIDVYACSLTDRNDLYQEILLNAWKSAPSFRKDSKFSTWLYQLAINTILTTNRRKKIVHYPGEMEDFSVAVNQQPEQADNIRHLYKAIRQLPEIDRAIITLHLEGYSNPEIAGMMGIKSNNLGVKLFRIKNQLQLILKSTI